MRKVIKAAKEAGYIIRLYYVGLNSSAESIERIRNRVRKGGHDIQAEDVLRRHGKRFEDLKAVLPYVDEAFFFDNENGFSEVGEYRNGELIPRGNPIPQWYKELVMAVN
ncbi:MAG: hypothetical protein LBS19_00125 [Clostridiales bacterium]|nr:hypothetical protein [Clostridiales bacterium]